MFYQPPDGEHCREADERHHQRVRAEERHRGHDQPAEERNQRPLFPAVKAIAARDRAPKAGGPEKILVEQETMILRVHGGQYAGAVLL